MKLFEKSSSFSQKGNTLLGQSVGGIHDTEDSQLLSDEERRLQREELSDLKKEEMLSLMKEKEKILNREKEKHTKERRNESDKVNNLFCVI